MIRSQMARTTATPLMLALLAGSASGQLAGEQVVAGQASFARSGSLTEITASNNAIISYQSFGVGAGETVRFVQPGADSRVLNRVLGRDATRIDGSLIANGRVYIVNEAGVYFGGRAVVSVGAIHAAAGRMSDADFLAGIDRFTNLTGAVENRGRIEAGEVHLAGRLVTNLGSIVSPDGLVTMSVGDRVLVGEHDGHVFVSATSTSGATGEAQQSGTIEAPRGRVMVGAGDMFSIAIGPGSVTRAASVDVRGGAGSVVRASGVIDVSDTAPGRMGGGVVITGEGVAVLGAQIDASGAAGGGTVHIGGGFQGRDASVRNAERVHVDRASVIRADAAQAGDGGEIVMWSDSATLFTGRASAQGGPAGGSGGLVEVSSAGWLGFFGHVTTRAPMGKDGLLLLDPMNIRIVSGAAGSAADDALLDDNQLPASEASLLDVVLSEGTIESLDDTDVLIAATGNIAVENLDDRVLSLPVTSGNTFTFDAGGVFGVLGFNDIVTSGGNLVIRGSGGVQTSSLNTGGGDLRLDAGDQIRVTDAIEDVGTLVVRSLGSNRTVALSGVEAVSATIEADTLNLAGGLVTRSALDLSGVGAINSTIPSQNFTIGAVDGVTTFPITIAPGTMIGGPGGLRFIASTLTLPAVNGLSSLEVTATEELILAGDLLMDNDADGLGGRVDLSDAEVVTLAADVRIDTDSPSQDEAAGAVDLSGTTVRAMAAGVQGLVIDTTTDTDKDAGRIEIGDIGGDRLLGSFEVLGGTLALRGVLSSGSDLDFAGVEAIEIAGTDAEIRTNGSALNLGDTPVDGAGDLAIDLGTGMGAFSHTGAFGANTPLRSLTLTGGSFTLSDVTTSGDQTYAGQSIGLPAALVSMGGVIDFTGAVAVAGDSAVEAIGGEVRFREAVTGAGSLTVETDSGFASFEESVTLGGLAVMGTVRFDGSAQTIQTTDDLVLGETLGRDRIEMLAGAKTFRSTGGDVLFNGPLNGPANVTIAAGPGVLGSDLPIIRFASNVGGAQSLASLVLGTGQSVVPQVASIVFAVFGTSGDPAADRSFTVRTSGNLTMRPNEKLTALGSLLLESTGGIVTLGDVTSSGAMRVNAPRIDIRTRAIGTLFEVDASQDPEALLDAAGRTDTGVDLVSGVEVLLDSGDIRVIGSGTRPTVADPLGEAKISGIQVRASNGLALADLFFNRRTGTGGGAARDETTVLDARATGSTTVPLAEGLPVEASEHSASFVSAESIFDPNPESGELPPGDQGGILLRRTTPEERKSAREGVIWHVDLAGSPQPGADDFRIASARLNPDAVVRFRRAWSGLAQAVGVPETDRGEVLARVRSVLGVAADQYKRSSGEEFVDPQHFALYADLRVANADAWRALELVSAITLSSQDLGLTPREAVRFRKGLVESIRPTGLDSVDLARLIEYAGRADRGPASVEAVPGQR